MTKIDPFSLTTIPIEMLANGHVIGEATGFTWLSRGRYFLITNWHVATGRNAETGNLVKHIRPDAFRMLVNPSRMIFEKHPRTMNLRDDEGRPVWYAHPQRQRGSDVIAIPIDELAQDPVVNLYPINTLRSEADLAVRIGMDVFILGYPFGAPPPAFPVWKRGSIASEPDLTRLGRGFLIVDTASRPGMSGAPVIRRSWGFHVLETDAFSQDGTPQSKFVGIYSGRFHTRDHTDAQLGMVWPVEDIEEIIGGARRDAD